MDIGEKQIQLINYVKFFLKNLESSNIKTSLSSFCYLTPWAETPGYARLKFWLHGWKYSFKYCLILFKNIFSIAAHSSYLVVDTRKTQPDCETLVLTWSFKQNFLQDGSIQDRYFLENSEELPKSHWLLVSMDGYVPKNLKSNIAVIKKRKGIFKYQFFPF